MVCSIHQRSTVTAEKIYDVDVGQMILDISHHSYVVAPFIERQWCVLGYVYITYL